MNSWKSFIATLTLLVITSVIHSIWIDKIKKRYAEMGAILSRIQTLHKSGELWKYKKEIPLNRTDFLRKECYAYTTTGCIILILIGLGIHEAIELFQSDWFSKMDRIGDAAYSGEYNIRAKGFLLIGLLRIFPIYALVILIGNGYSTLVWIKEIMPTLLKYIRKDIKG